MLNQGSTLTYSACPITDLKRSLRDSDIEIRRNGAAFSESKSEKCGFSIENFSKSEGE